MESGGRRKKNGKGEGEGEVEVEEGDEGKMLKRNQTIIKLLSHPHFRACICTQIGRLTWLCTGTLHREILPLCETLLTADKLRCLHALHTLLSVSCLRYMSGV